MAIEVQVSFPLAFLAGVVSFLSPCILPVVPSYLAFVSGLSLEELQREGGRAARATAMLHSILFMVGFGLVFMTLGLVATAAGARVTAVLPWVNRIGGGVIVVFGLFLLGLPRLPVFSREARLKLNHRPVGALGSILVGVAFGAGWSPCIGPVLGAVLLYAGLEATMLHGTMLLAAYALGLGVPFVASAAGLSWFFTFSDRARAWVLPLRRLAGVVLLVVGSMMVTGRFARVTAFLAGLGQLINLEIS